MRALLLAVLLAGCSKKADPGPGCPKVVDNMLAVMKQGLTGHDSVALGDRTQMIEQCERRKMSAKERKCLAEAKDLSALASCRDAKSPPPPENGIAPPQPTPTRPLPLPTGSAAPGADTAAPSPAPAPAGSAAPPATGSGG